MTRNLNSKSACIQTYPITFGPPAEHNGIISYHTVNEGRQVWSGLLELVQGDHDTEEELEAGSHAGHALAQPAVHADGIIGELRLIEGAATDTQARAVNVMALDLPGHGHYWFWTTRDAQRVLANLVTDGHLVHTAITTRATSPVAHGQQYMLLWATFDQANFIDDSDELKSSLLYINGDDVTPEAPEDALATLQSVRYLSRLPVLRSLADDRYADLLQDWELWVAERVGIVAAEYLEVRRRYMWRFYTAVRDFREAKELPPSTDERRFGDYKNKVDLLTAVRGWIWSRRRAIVTAWDELGLLDESKFFHEQDEIAWQTRLLLANGSHCLPDHDPQYSIAEASERSCYKRIARL